VSDTYASAEDATLGWNALQLGISATFVGKPMDTPSQFPPRLASQIQEFEKAKASFDAWSMKAVRWMKRTQKTLTPADAPPGWIVNRADNVLVFGFGGHIGKFSTLDTQKILLSNCAGRTLGHVYLDYEEQWMWMPVNYSGPFIPLDDKELWNIVDEALIRCCP